MLYPIRSTDNQFLRSFLFDIRRVLEDERTGDVDNRRGKNKLAG
jgi:hypothetical protein